MHLLVVLSISGQPFLVKCQENVHPTFWKPSQLAQQFGKLKGRVSKFPKDGTRSTILKMAVRDFFLRLENPGI